MNLFFFFCWIHILFPLISCKSLASYPPEETNDLTDLNSLYDGLSQIMSLEESGNELNNFDASYLIPDQVRHRVETTTKSFDYQGFEISPDYELILNQYGDSYPIETPQPTETISKLTISLHF